MNAQIPQNCDINPGEKTSNMIDESNQGNYEKRSSKKVRRAFSMPRNPFRWSRKFITNKSDCSSSVLTERIREGQQSSMTCSSSTNFSKSLESDDKDQGQHNENNLQSPKIFRRSSFRRLLSRIAQHVTSVSIGINKTSVTANVPDRVPPIGGYQWPPDQTPGVTGLKNHGNTCFMNAVLQCLSHTDILAEYFVLDQYKADLKRRNKLNSKKFGTKGELTEQLANVLKALWTCKNENDHSTSFKAVVDRYGSQFRSSTQHDAQEFLFWLLDKVHEDLNMATKKRYKTVKNNYGRPDEVIAAETLANHIRCNNSFVQAVFQAQFRSSLTCPRCKKQSNTFDPFHCISVQLPQLSQQIIFVTVLYVTQHPRQVKLGLSVPPGSSILALRKQLHADTGIAINRMVLADVNEQGFSRVFYDSQSISTLDGLETIYCIEVPDTKKENTSDLILLIANVRKSDNDSTCRFGPPISVQVNRDCSYVELQKKLLKEMSSTLKPEVFAYNTPLTEMFQIRLQDPSADPDTYLEEVEHPLFMEIIDMALSVLSSDAGPTHIKLLLEWSQPELYFADLSDPIVEHESVALLKGSKSEQTVLTLEQCLEHYTRAETLSAEDAWRCPSCQQYLPVVKTLGLWSLPDILVIHFKRFRQQHDKGADAAKLTTMVKFPLNSFDMSPHLARGSSFNDSINEDHSRNSNSPWKKARDHRHKDRYLKENRYDLYAVCYHQGETLETGHYTAACKNPYDHQWYKFDDQRVSHVPVDQIQEEIVNNEAYILFYQRRKIDNSECSGTSSSSGDHWVSRIAAPLVPQSSCNLVTVEAGSSHNSEIAERMSQEGEIKAVAVENDGECKLDSSITLKSAIVMEKTDESELVDIESLEFMDEGNVLVEDGVKEDKEFILQDPKVAINGNVVIKVSNKEISEESPQKEALVLQKSDQITLPSAGVGGLNVLAESSKIKAASLQLSNGVISHPLVKSSSYKMKNCDSLTLRRNTSSSCSKDTLIFIDQPTHSLIDNEETFLDSRSLWISPVAPHKLITVSPKN